MSDNHPSTTIHLFGHADLRDALEKLRQAKSLGSNPLQKLVWVRCKAEGSGPAPTPMAFEIALGEAFTQLIEENLTHLRQLEGLRLSLPETREAELEALLDDFSRGNVELEAWSLLYYRYVRVDLNLRVQDVAYMLQVDSRQVRRRLTHGCRRLTEQVSLLERDARAQHCQLWMRIKLPPVAHTPLFGRDSQLADLIELLCDPASTGAVGLIGPGGIGKTALAHAAALAIIERNAFRDMAWLRLDGPTTFRALLDALALTLGYPHLITYDLGELEGAIRAYLLRTPTLIILDEAENLQGYPDRLEHLVSLAGEGRLLLTTQHHPPGNIPIRLIIIPPLTQDDMAALVRHHIRQRRISRDAIRPDDETIRCICAAVGGNPLAAQLVAGQVGALPLTRILNNLEGLKTAEGIPLFRSLFAPTWEELDDQTRTVALAFCLLPADGGLWDDLQRLTGLSSDALDRAIVTLVARSLLDSSGDEPRYTIHTLIRRFVATRADSPPDNALYSILLADAMATQESTEIPEAQASVLHQLTIIRAHAESGNALDALVNLITQVAPFVHRVGYWAPWEALLTQAAERLREVNEMCGLAKVLVEMGIVQHWIGKSDAAMANFQEAIEICGELGDFVGQADALCEVGKLYHELGQTTPAYEAYQRAAAAAKRYDSPSHFRKAAIGLAALALYNNRPDQALDVLNQALNALAEDDPPDCDLLGSLCAAHLQANEPEQALRYQLQALNIFKSVGDLPNQARGLLRLGTVHVTLSQFDEALNCLQHCLALMRGLGDALGQARTLTNLGTVYRRRQEPEQALSTWEEALTLQQQLHDQIGLSYTLYNLADLQWALGNQQAAQTAMAQSRTLAERLNLVVLLERIADHPQFREPPQT